MPVLDASAIQDENDIDQVEQVEKAEQADQADAVTIVETRSVTLELPAECQTRVTLLIGKGSDGLYCSGFKVTREYETTPYEPAAEALPEADAAEEYHVETIGAAVIDAVDSAAFWLETNSDDADEKYHQAHNALRAWLDEFDEDTATESIFDEVEPEAADTQAEPVATDMEPIVDTRCPMCETTLLTTPGVTDEAQREWDDRKHALEELIGRLAIEQVRLKAAVKQNRESLTDQTEELEKHLIRGPERLPLFDREKSSAERRIEAERQTDTSPAPAPETAVDTETADASPEASTTTIPAGNDAWRSVTIEDAGILPAICKLLRESNDIGTLGQIADHCKTYALTDLKKIGQAKADKIEEALTAFWAANPQYGTAEDSTVEIEAETNQSASETADGDETNDADSETADDEDDAVI